MSDISLFSKEGTVKRNENGTYDFSLKLDVYESDETNIPVPYSLILTNTRISDKVIRADLSDKNTKVSISKIK